MIYAIGLCILFAAIIIFLTLALLKKSGQLSASKKEYSDLFSKYKGIIDIDEYKERIRQESETLVRDRTENIRKLENDLKAHEERIRNESEQMIKERTTSINQLEYDILQLKEDYRTKRIFFEKLLNEISLYEEHQELMSYGLYKPHFDYDTSDKYKGAIEIVREKSKNMIKNDEAVLCIEIWLVNGSRAEGTKQTKQYIKLMLRAFNGEAEALLADVRWNNILKMEERLTKSYEIINKLGETHTISITNEYYQLKMEELRLTFEYRDKMHQEREEQRQIQEQIREEEKAQKEIEKVLKESEDEEKRYNKALEQAKKELEKAHGENIEKIKIEMERLQKEIEESRALKERALSMAQQTKAGHVYVISNIGSFGENIYKIGMTRRLDPLDRVKELGDASVPFGFDVHGMIYSENAPELETMLHREFDARKINLINDRKEFFNVSINEIEEVVSRYDSKIELTKLAEAREYKESLSIRESWKNIKTDVKEAELEKYPEHL